ncbi:hypothetical protein CYMTET_8075 [Cymbomonas tetramitiformis]|uniref:Uncharacterized protein n=1 Tax=Cymbomonas tetramitiformis TaxID=36881 RepID=A0AAE0GTR8_9CHLO|nr:hypothetical protein CYMTET_8075 [Cymbomonas tetramitiformis]
MEPQPDPEFVLLDKTKLLVQGLSTFQYGNEVAQAEKQLRQAEDRNVQLEQEFAKGAESTAGAPDKGAVAPSWPKVITTTRTEILARRTEDYYTHAFAPIETMGRHDRGTTEDPRELLLELRIVPFTDQVEPCINAKVALEVRRRFELRVGAIASLSKKDAGALREEAHEVASVLAVVLKEPPQDFNTRLLEFCRQQFTQSDERRIWMLADYQKVLDAILELRDLATTPFVMEILTEILPELQKKPTSDAAIKAALLLLLTEKATQEELQNAGWRRECGPQEHFPDGGGCDAIKELAALSATVTDALLRHDMLLAQPKLLLEMTRIEVWAMQRKSHPVHIAALAEEIWARWMERSAECYGRGGGMT